jgi:dsRNA-specific ribonuclease
MPDPDACPPSLQRLAGSCQDALLYTFRNPELLHQALGILTPPLTPEQAAARQRLEFLGDAAWNFAVADTAFHLWPDAGAGDLTRLRATWSSRSGLARLARQLALPIPDVPGGLASAGGPGPERNASSEEPSTLASDPLLESEGMPSAPGAAPGAEGTDLGGTRQAGPSERVVAELPRSTTRTDTAPSPVGPSERVVAELPRSTTRTDTAPSPVGPSERVVAELFEAILGAMVMDGGLDPVRELARRVIGQAGEPAAPPPMDPKSALQILAQSRFGTLPTYRLLERHGPPHHPTFRVEVTVRGDAGNVAASAEGPSRQTAEREAARRALGMLSD